MKTIPYNKQYLDDIDISEVKKSLTSDIIAAGPLVDKFEFKSSLIKWLLFISNEILL